MIAITEKLSWYVARSGGIVAWLLITASIVWGLLLSSRLVRKQGVPAWLLDLHKYLGTLALVFTGVHIAGLVGDNWAHYGWREILIPLTDLDDPSRGPSALSVAWGIVAFYLLIAIQVTSWLMRRMPRKVWHAIHLSSIALFVAGSIHSFTSGKDRWNRLWQMTAIIGLLFVLQIAFFRILTLRTKGKWAIRADPRADKTDQLTPR
jgi:DMSO/TMAO reductase YedYZ heme-binding membrane subunit